ncbi:MAG: hypothetical protein KGL18_04720 [Burkholderiales bacterium]|nr:hypothetical protein [Burkholderiales bacterium]MDE1926712.1 hypothetical protein [Burkholderiales bacterium]MDE2158688.1 hypothetical protein [Burkholderiales bacterium]MDE2502268.1 hypothetical protein [Burkholderiales bacterium]
MKPFRIAALLLAASGALAVTGARAASSASSEMSDSASTAIGSLSNSITGSSQASSPDERRYAAGAYRIVAIDAVDAAGAAGAPPGTVAVRLQALAEPGAAGAFTLHLPRKTAAQARLATGGLVQVRLRPYGVEFAQGARREPFFLVLEDDWYRELQTRAVAI